MKLYVDASAFVKLLVEEEGSGDAALFASRATEIAASSILYVEARAGLHRAERDERLPGTRRHRARIELERVWSEIHVVDLDLDLVVQSGDVAELTGLRAGDAIHLASALALDEPELVLVTWYRDLAQAAREAGLAVAP